MRNRHIAFTVYLFCIAVLAGYLLSKMSFLGRVGVNFFYKEYKFLKVWWQGGGVLFAIFMLLFGLQYILRRRLALRKGVWVQLACIVLALAGLYFTYQDFRHTFSHRILKERFHLGGYLFWIGWISISLYCLIGVAPAKPTGSGNKAATVQ